MNDLKELSAESEKSLSKLSIGLQKEKVSGWKVMIVSLCKNLIQVIHDSFKINANDTELKRSSRTFTAAIIKALGEGDEESPINLVKYFRQFRNTKGDIDLEVDYAEKLIVKAGGFQQAKNVIEWCFTSDIPEFSDPNKRPWRMYEVYVQFGLYIKHNDPREKKRQELIREFYQKGK